MRIGTAGIPRSTPKPGTSFAAIDHLEHIGLDAMELEFVRSIFLNEESAEKLGEHAKRHGVALTAHASYFVNLNAQDAEKVEASFKRILDATRILDRAGGYSVVYHPGFYLKEPHEKVFETMRTRMKRIERAGDDEGLKPYVRPETMGKLSQFGSLNELLKICQSLDRAMPCIDFAHIHARSIGKGNSQESFERTFALVEEHLGREGLDEMHVHFSGIAYSDKGERNHLTFDESGFDESGFARAIRSFRPKGVFISESPNIEDDALRLKGLLKAYK